MAVFRQLLLLVWKNVLLQIRRPKGTIFELLIPPLAVVFLIGLSAEVILPILFQQIWSFKAVDVCFVTFDSDHLVPVSYLPPEPLTVYYTPNNSDTAAIVGIIQKKLPSFTTMVGVASEQDFLSRLYVAQDNRTYGCFKNGSAIVFNTLNGSNIEYTIRLSNPDIPSLTQSVTPANVSPGARVNGNYYLTQGFLHLQNAIGQAIIEWKTNQSVDVPIDVRQFPYPSYHQDAFLTAIGSILPILIVMSFMYTAAVFVKELVIEKETRIRESMKMMGLSQWVLWTSWFIKQFLFLLISIVTMTVLFKFGKVFTYSNEFLIFLFLLCYSLSIITFGYMISVWFNSPRVGVVVGFMSWYVSYLPYTYAASSYSTLTLGAKMGLCLFSNTCMGLAIQVISSLELQQLGVTFQTFAKPASLDDSFNLAYVCGMLILDAILYMLIACYVDAVKPGEYGVPRPLYFPFLPSYWLGRSLKTTPPGGDAAPLLDDCSSNHDPSAHEEQPVDLVAGISIRNLRKVFRSWPKKPKVAVEDISLTMYRDHITVLLGHNGAGKTTTLSILTGLYTPTSGDAIVNGHSILTEMDQVRSSLGICPQHNVLFDRLTVREHLWFFMKLKGIEDKKKVDAEVAAMIEDLLMVAKTNVPSSQLSGGMKRKLSVAIALIGGSQVVILDEPTSGMDPYARRATWDLLAKHKKGRTLLLTTHHMDEADLLGDRIAIMVEGKLHCSGSSLFLKKRFGVGYHMTVVKEVSCDPHQVAELVLRSVDGAQWTTDVGAELSFTLPSACTDQFPAMFELLEARQKELGISSYGVSVTTLEEVFIKVGVGLAVPPAFSHPVPAPPHTHSSPSPHAAEQQKLTLSLGDIASNNLTTLPGEVPMAPIEMIHIENCSSDVQKRNTTAESSSYTLNTGLILWLQQLYAILLKRFYISTRFWGTLVTQLALPVLFVLQALLLSKTTIDSNTASPLRPLTIPSSAPFSTTSFFYAALGGDAGINFSSVNPASLGMTDFFDYTGAVNDIIESVGNNSNVSQCCSYENQLLDQFCASRMAREINATCATNPKFGYKSCLNCLGCCCARSNQLPTCTSPLPSSAYPTSSQDFCPAPPKLPFGHTPLWGPLQDKSAFVAEHLLNLSSQQTPALFFRQFQGGFVVGPRDPAFSTCSAATPTQTCSLIQKVSKVLQGVSCGGGEEGEGQYSQDLSLRNLTCVCSSNISTLGTCFSSSCSASDLPTLSSCYVVDGVPSGCLQGLACWGSGGCGPAQQNSSSPVGATYPPQDSNLAVTVWYNNQPYHMAAAALNALHNIILQKKYGMEGVTISVNNYPLPMSVNDEVSSAATTSLGFTIGISVVFRYSFLFASSVLFLVQERESKSKHLQFVSGVHASSYWVATFLWDLVCSLVPVVFSVVLFAGFQVTGYTGEGLAGVAMLLLFSCWASIPFVYSFSFLFKSSLVAYGITILILYLTTLVFVVIYFVFNIIGSSDIARILNYIFLLNPSYGLAVGLYNIYSNNAIREVCTKSNITELVCQQQGIDYVNSIFEFQGPAIGHILLYQALEGVLFIVLTILIERKFLAPELKGLIAKCTNARGQEQGGDITGAGNSTEDEDVVAERQRVLSGSADHQAAVLIKNLTKVYSGSLKVYPGTLKRCSYTPAKPAVQGISLAIPSGECFGLLGVNGAGKTSVFGVLTGDIAMTDGTAVIAGYDIRTNLRQVQQSIGYCPQFDALLDCLTGREHLTLFARLRGIPEAHIKGVVDRQVERLDLSKHVEDEPTTGLDPTTRRYLWDVLVGVVQDGHCIVLSSHSMEECEVLCTRLAIMAKGQFKCLGSIQHLKSRFGSGFTLQVKVKPLPLSAPDPTSVSLSDLKDRPKSPENADSTELLHTFIQETFPGANLSEEHQGQVTYHLPAAGFSWSLVFRALEGSKERLGIVDYSISQTTLEQVFLGFAAVEKEGAIL